MQLSSLFKDLGGKLLIRFMRTNSGLLFWEDRLVPGLIEILDRKIPVNVVIVVTVVAVVDVSMTVNTLPII